MFNVRLFCGEMVKINGGRIFHASDYTIRPLAFLTGFNVDIKTRFSYCGQYGAELSSCTCVRIVPRTSLTRAIGSEHTLKPVKLTRGFRIEAAIFAMKSTQLDPRITHSRILYLLS